MSETERNITNFGYREVPAGDKQGLVNDVFAKVAERYDQMNDLMSGGLHRLWKDDLITLLAPPRNDRPFAVLDMAGGTGDIAFRIARASGAGTTITVADISPEMIAEGKIRATREAYGAKCRFTVANAEALGLPDKSFDAYTIAFGIRNVTHIDRALAEAYRVLRPGGHFLCLEFSHVDVPGLAALYDAYSLTAIPAMGKVVTGDGAPYRYLVESIRTFPQQETFREMIAAAGFARASYRNLAGGIVAIHSGWRL
jgi:demethylmenaquinone methyltransferase / 2-methoxy-6-polyprenyl-1,4-benzoquinol methylase